MNRQIKIYRHDGDLRYITDIMEGSKVKFTLHKEEYLSLKFKVENDPITFRLGDYIDAKDYESEEVEITSEVDGVPVTKTVTQKTYKLDGSTSYQDEYGNDVFSEGSIIPLLKGRFYELTESYSPKYNESTNAYEYEIQFNAYYFKWGNKKFKLVTTTSTEENVTCVARYNETDSLTYKRSESSWSLTASLSSQLEMVIKNLYVLGDHFCKTYDNKTISYLIDDSVSKEAKAMSYDNENIIDALYDLAEELDCDCWIEDDIIRFGRLETTNEAIPIRQGIEAKNITTSDSSKTFATRVYGYGSTKNLPNTYRKHLIFSTEAKDNDIQDPDRKLYTKFFAEQYKTYATVTDSKGESGVLYNAPLFANDTLFKNTLMTVECERVSLHIGRTIVTKPAEPGDDDYEKHIQYVKQKNQYDAELEKYNNHESIKDCSSLDKVKVLYGENIDKLNLYTKVSGKDEESQDVVAITEYNYSEHLEADGSISSDLTLFFDLSYSVDAPDSDYTMYLRSLSHDTIKNDTLTMYSYNHNVLTAKCAYPSVEVHICDVEGNFLYNAVLNPNHLRPSDENSGELDVLGDYESQTVIVVTGPLKYTISNIMQSKVNTYYFTDDEDAQVTNAVYERRLMLPTSVIESGTTEYEQSSGKTYPTYGGNGFCDAKDSLSDCEVVEDSITFDDIYPHKDDYVTDVKTYTYTEKLTDSNTGDEYPKDWNAYIIKSSLSEAFDEDYILDTSEGLHITFSTGLLAGMTFEVKFGPYHAGDTSEDVSGYKYYFEIIANEDYSRRLPDEVLFPKAACGTADSDDYYSENYKGDSFTLTGYDSTAIGDLGLIAEAEKELLKETREYLEKAVYYDKTYEATLYPSYAESKVFLLGDKMTIKNPNFIEDERSVRVIGYEMFIDMPYDNPKYTLGEAVSYSRMKDIENQLKQVASNGKMVAGNTSGTGTGSVYLIGKSDNTTPTEQNAYSAVRSNARFLNKEANDTTNYDLGMKNANVKNTMTSQDATVTNKTTTGYLDVIHDADVSGDLNVDGDATATRFKSKNYESGELTGSGVAMYEASSDDGTGNSISNGYIETDYMAVRKSAWFRELTIEEVKHVGGEVILSQSACVLSGVTETVIRYNGEAHDVYRCFFDTEANGKHQYNDWEVGDQARCQSCGNIADAGTYQNVATKYYWRLVVGVHRAEGDEKYHYIDLSKTICDTLAGASLQLAEDASSAPAANDSVVLAGSRSGVKSRSSLQIFSTVEANAPSRRYYHNVITFSFSGCAIETMEWDATADGGNGFPHWRVGDSDSYVDFSEDGLKIQAKEVKLSSGKTVEETAQDAAESLSNGGFTIHQQEDTDDFEYPTPNDLEVDGKKPYINSARDSYTETLTLADEVGNYFLTKKGYLFVLKYDATYGYYWHIVTDRYLISSTNTAESALEAAENAQKEAEAASAAAQEAQDMIGEIGADGILTPSEKRRLEKEWVQILQNVDKYTIVCENLNLLTSEEYVNWRKYFDGRDHDGNAYSGCDYSLKAVLSKSKTQYKLGFFSFMDCDNFDLDAFTDDSNLNLWLNTEPVTPFTYKGLDGSGTEYTSAKALNKVFEAYYNTYTALMQKIADKQKELSDAAQETASSALTRLSNMADDNKITDEEKVAMREEKLIINKEVSSMKQMFNLYRWNADCATAYETYRNAFFTLNTIYTTIIETTGDYVFGSPNITRAEYESAIENMSSTKQEFLNACSAADRIWASMDFLTRYQKVLETTEDGSHIVYKQESAYIAMILEELNTEKDGIDTTWKEVCTEDKSGTIETGSETTYTNLYDTYVTRYNTIKAQITAYSALTANVTITDAKYEALMASITNYKDARKAFKSAKAGYDADFGVWRNYIGNYFEYDDDKKGVHVKDNSGLVTTSNYADMFSTQTKTWEDGRTETIEAHVTTMIDDGVSKVEITAQNIDLEGYTSVNGKVQIDERGTLYAEQSEFTGIMKHGYCVINDSNYASYGYIKDTVYYVDIKKAGSLIVLNGANIGGAKSVVVLLPYFEPTNEQRSWSAKYQAMKARQFVGSYVCIYNCLTGVNCNSVTAKGMYDNGSYYYPVAAQHFLSGKCVAKTKSDAETNYEYVCWEKEGYGMMNIYDVNTMFAEGYHVVPDIIQYEYNNLIYDDRVDIRREWTRIRKKHAELAKDHTSVDDETYTAYDTAFNTLVTYLEENTYTTDKVDGDGEYLSYTMFDSEANYYTMSIDVDVAKAMVTAWNNYYTIEAEL